MKKLYTFILIIFLSSCSLGGKKAVDKIYYRLSEPTVTFSSDTNPLVVNRPSALGILGNRPMVVQNEEGGLIQMQHNFWLESPKVLMQNYFNKVFNVKPDHPSSTKKLDVEILHLEKKQDTAILELKFVIKDKTGVTVFNKTYLLQMQLKENTIPQFVQSISAMLNNMTLSLLEDVK